MYGIPTVTVDYTNDTAIFDPNDKDQFQVDPSLGRENNVYRLSKTIIAVYRKAGLPVRVGKEVAARNATQIIDALLNPVVEVEAEGCSAERCGCGTILDVNEEILDVAAETV